MSDKALTYVVVNADDLGLHPAVTRAVLFGHREGIVTSASLLTNMTHTEEAAEAVRGTATLGVGVHLNALRGTPLLPPRHLRKLAGRAGRLPGTVGWFALRYFAGRIPSAEIGREWAAQIERAIALGIRPTHLDSEKHVHCLPGLFELTCDLAARYGIGWVRRVREPVSWARWDAAAIRARVVNLSQRISSRNRSANAPHFADEVWGVSRVGKRFDLNAFDPQRDSRNESGLIEVICHPGRTLPGDPPIPADVGYLRAPRHWMSDLEQLTGPAAQRLRKHPRLRLTHFGDVEMDLFGGK